MSLFRIDAGHVRTAMTRLVTDGWLERERIGRNSYYRLSKREEASFAAATKRIYFDTERHFDGRLLRIPDFRRIVLRDPALPGALLPTDWPGATAGALAARVYRRLVPAAEM